MYNFVYYFMYKFREGKTGDLSDARFTASLAVIIAIVFHLFLIIAGVRYYYDYENKLFEFTNNKQINRLIMAGIGLVLILIGALFFNKRRSSRIIDQFENRIDNIFSIKNIIIFLLITIVPLLLGIYLLNNSSMVLKMK